MSLSPHESARGGSGLTDNVHDFVGGQIIQEACSRQLLQNLTHRRFLTRKGHRSRESRCRGQAAQLCHPQVRACTAHQERKEGHRFRSCEYSSSILPLHLPVPFMAIVLARLHFAFGLHLCASGPMHCADSDPVERWLLELRR